MAPGHPGVAQPAGKYTNTRTDGTGAVQLQISHNKTGFVWIISQMAVRSDPPGVLNVEVKYDSYPLLTPTAMISGAAAQGDPSIQIGDHDIINIFVTAAIPLSIITFTFYYDEIPGS